MLCGNLRDYKLNIYNYEETKLNTQKKGPIVIDMNIHPSLAIKIEDKKIYPSRIRTRIIMIPSK